MHKSYAILYFNTYTFWILHYVIFDKRYMKTIGIVFLNYVDIKNVILQVIPFEW